MPSASVTTDIMLSGAVLAVVVPTVMKGGSISMDAMFCTSRSELTIGELCLFKSELTIDWIGTCW